MSEKVKKMMDENKAMDILILLLGGNPLPNYVVAKYILSNKREELPVPDRLVFISTNRSEPFYGRIRELLMNKYNLGEGKFIPIKLDYNPRNPKYIQKQIRRELRNHFEKIRIQSVHFNFNGGTKAMDMHGMIAVKHFCDSQKITNLIISDLDPDTFKIYVSKPEMDQTPTPQRYPKGPNLLSLIKISIEDILKIHKMTLDEKSKGTDLCTYDSNVCDDFAEQAVREFTNIEDMTNKGKKSSANKNFYNLMSAVKKHEKINEGSNEELEESKTLVKKKFPAIYQIFIDCLDDTSEADKDGEKKTFYRFIYGGWLEDYLLNTLRNIETEMGITQLKKNVRAYYKDEKKRKLEIDVIAMRGYHMFLFSCTTSQRIKVVKQKAFEALYRAKQLGGEHAQVIIVSTMFDQEIRGYKFTEHNNLEQLKNELEQFDAQHKCHLIGLCQLSSKQKLEDKLKNIIKGIQRK